MARGEILVVGYSARLSRDDIVIGLSNLGNKVNPDPGLYLQWIGVEFDGVVNLLMVVVLS